MDKDEIVKIDESARAIVRRAYDLGRSEALRRVVEVLKEENPSAEQFALMAPEPDHEPDQAHHEALANGMASSEKSPWWAWRVK